MMVTLLAWIAHKLVSSNKPTKYASDASCKAKTAEDWNRKSVLKSWAISLTKRWNGYFRISLNATVPGRYLCGFLTPPVAGADLRAALVASCFLGALPPVDLRAVCLVRAIVRFLTLSFMTIISLSRSGKTKKREERRRHTKKEPALLTFVPNNYIYTIYFRNYFNELPNTKYTYST